MEYYNSPNSGSNDSAIRKTKFNRVADSYRWTLKGKTRSDNATPSSELKNILNGKKKHGFYCKEKTSPGFNKRLTANC